MEKNMSNITRRQGKDVLSSLPDDIIVDILSHLPLKFAVKTDVLSKRWRYLWTHINVVDIDLKLRDLDNIPKFSKILNQVFRKLTSPKIRKFKVNSIPTYFYISSEINESTTRLFNERWFNKICVSNVEEIELKHFGSAIPQLPTCLFKCKSLVSLELSKGGFLLNLPQDGDFINLPHLKKLIVGDIETWDSSICGFSEKLIKFSPSLEDLSLIFDQPSQYPFNICGMNLKRLLIGFKNSSWHHGKFITDTPKLEYLSLNAYKGFSVVDSNTMALLDARFQTGYTDTGGDARLNTMTFVDAPWCLTSASYVIMSTMVRSFEINLCPQIRPLIKLPYLTRLELCDVRNFCTKRFLQILHCCPVLEVLVYRFQYITKKEEDDDLSGDSPDSIVPECLLTHVRKIEMNTWLINRWTLKLIEFLLRKARVLELLIFKAAQLHPIDDQYEELGFCKEIYECQRSSPRCQIEYSGNFIKVPKEGGTVIDHDGDMVFLK